MEGESLRVEIRAKNRACHSSRHTAQAARVMATLRNVSISLLRLHGVTNIAAALRYNAGKNQRILKRLGLSPA